MSERQNIEEILRRLDELLVILKRVVNDLQEISISLRSIAAVSPPTVPAPITPTPMPSPIPTLPKMPTPTPTPTPAPRKRTIADVKIMFPQELEDLLTFTEKENYIIIKPRQYLGPENFAKVASIVRGAGGEYISAKKDSHFRLSKQLQ